MALLYPRSRPSNTDLGIARKIAYVLRPEAGSLEPDCGHAIKISVCPSQTIFQLLETPSLSRLAGRESPQSATSAWD